MKSLFNVWMIERVLLRMAVYWINLQPKKGKIIFLNKYFPITLIKNKNNQKR